MYIYHKCGGAVWTKSIVEQMATKFRITRDPTNSCCIAAYTSWQDQSNRFSHDDDMNEWMKFRSCASRCTWFRTGMILNRRTFPRGIWWIDWIDTTWAEKMQNECVHRNAPLYRLALDSSECRIFVIAFAVDAEQGKLSESRIKCRSQSRWCALENVMVDSNRYFMPAAVQTRVLHHKYVFVSHFEIFAFIQLRMPSEQLSHLITHTR